MQIHYALRTPPTWKAGDELGKVALIHLTDGLDAVSRSSNEAERGLLPAEPTVCVGQPTALDPSRAPDGTPRDLASELKLLGKAHRGLPGAPPPTAINAREPEARIRKIVELCAPAKGATAAAR